MLGKDEGLVLGASVAIVDTLLDVDGRTPLVGDGEATATLHPAKRLAAARPTTRPRMRPRPGSWLWDAIGLMACPRSVAVCRWLQRRSAA